MRFSDLVDITELKDLCESFTAATGAATALLERDGTIIIATGWQDICTQFHRVNPDTAALCLESDTVLSEQLMSGERYNLYKCRNGLVDVAVPVIIEGEHLANFFAGQFFLAPPDRQFFIRQAEKYGFDLPSYLAALDKAPIYSEEEVRRLMDFLSRLARIMGEMGLIRMRLERANADLTANQERLEEEIDERQRTESLLRENEQKLRINEMRLQQSQAIAHVASWEFDIGTGRIWGTEEGARMYGLTPRQDGTLPLEEVEARAVDRKKVRNALMNLIEHDIPYDIEIEVDPADGSSRRVVWAVGALIRDQWGKPSRVIGVVQDITRQKEIEFAIRESEERFRTLVEQAPFSIQILSPEGKVLSINQACVNMWGIRFEELNDYNILQDEQIRSLGLMPFVERGFHGETSEIPPALYDARDSLGKGIKRWVQSRLYPIRDRQGSIQSLVLMQEDITGQMEALEALKKSESRYRRIVETANEGIWSMDAHHLTTFVNTKMAEMLGYPVQEIIGKPITDFMFAEDLTENARQMGLRHSGENSIYDGRIRRKDGGIRWMKVSATPLFDDKGAFAGSFAMLSDITEQKTAEEALIRKNEELAAATEEMMAIDAELRHNFEEFRKVQDAFGLARKKLNLLNQVTFEDLQSGLFSLSAYLELMDGAPGIKESQERYVERQRAILGSLAKSLAFAKNYQGLGMTPPRWQNVNQVFLLAISHIDLSGISRDIKLDSLEIYADPLLERVFGILAENVLKWGDGATAIRLYYTEQEDHLVLFFEDNGQGIPLERKTHLFPSEVRQAPALGLYLAQEILSITGISIQETGEPGKGARFEMIVPNGEYRFS